MLRALVAMGLLLAVGACDACGEPDLAPVVILPPALPEVVDFGEVTLGGRATRDVVLRVQPGSEPPLLESVAVSGPFAVERTSPLPASVDPALALVLRFEPALEGPAAGVLRLSTNATSDAVVEVPLIGVGTPPPPCDPLGPCLAVHFDVEAGVCVQTPLEGPCDDGSACTVNDVCVDGSCVGAPLVCEGPDVSCFVSRCDAADGCVVEPSDALCDDGDPCTVDRCLATGCESTVAEDGTPCAEVSCTTLALCFGGVCQETSTPDGFLCDDDDSCTDGDQCLAGACTGTPTSGGPAIAASAWTHGAARATAVRLGERIVIRDVYDTDSTGLYTVLFGSEGTYAVHHHHLELDGRGFSPALTRFGDRGFAAMHFDGGLELFEVDPESSAIAPVGVVELAQDAEPWAGNPLLVTGDEASLVAGFHWREELFLLFGEHPGLTYPPTALPLPAAPLDLAADGEGIVYAALANGSLVRLYLYAGAFPPPVTVVRESGDRLVSASGSMVAVSRPDDGALGGARVIDLVGADGEVQGQIAPLEMHAFFDVIGDIALFEGRLAVLLDDAVQLYDVSSPIAPALLAEAPLQGGASSLAQGALHLDEEVLIVSSRTLYGSGLRIFDVRSDTLSEVHVFDGSFLQLVDNQPDLPQFFGLHRQAAFATLLGDVEMHRWPLLHRPAGGDVVYRFVRPDGGTLAWPIGFRPDGVFSGYGDLPVITIHLAGLDVTETGAWTEPFAPGVLSVISDGAIGHAMRMSNDNEAFFDVYDFASAGYVGPPLLASLALALPGADRNNITGLARDAARVAAFMEHDWSFDTPPELLRSEVLLLDVAVPSAPAVLASTTLEGLVRGVLPLGDVVYGVLRGSGWYNTDYEGELLFRLDREGPLLVVGDIVPIERAARVVWAGDGRLAVATEVGMAFLEDGAAGLVPAGTLALPAPPTDAVSLGPQLLVATGLGPLVVDLPCP